MKKQKPPPLPELKAAQRPVAPNAWMITFADLTSLLMCFFVLIFSTQTLDRNGWQNIAGSFRAEFTPRPNAVAVVPSGQNNAIPVTLATRNVMYLDSLFRQQLGQQGLPGLVGQHRTRGSGTEEMAYTLPAEWHNPASAEARKAMAGLGSIIRTWSTPVTLRVVVPAGANWQAAAEQAVGLATAAGVGGLSSQGVSTGQGGASSGLAAELISGKIGRVEWVISSAE